MTTYDPTDVTFKVVGVGSTVVDEAVEDVHGFERITNWSPQKTASGIGSAGGVVRGKNKQKAANGITFNFEIGQDSEHLDNLLAIADKQADVMVVAEVTENLDDYEDSQIGQLGVEDCCIEVDTGPDVGQQEADVVTFGIVAGKGPIRKTIGELSS